MSFRITTLLVLAVVLLAINVKAQNLPKIQQKSLQAPPNIKIDGKATDWNNEFQAYNRSTDIYYSIANDANNLYLVIKSPENLVNRNLVNNTFSFSINKLGDGTKTLSLSLPLFASTDKGSIWRTLKPLTGIISDSLVTVLNSKLDKAKEFMVNGFDGITDENISVYNYYGIKAQGRFDNTRALTYELVIPRKFINTTSNKLNYTIRIYGQGGNDKNTVVTLVDGGVQIVNKLTGQISVFKATPETMSMTATTDFTADYELAK